MQRILLASALLALALPASAKVFQFKDWAVACDNIRHCEANGTQAGDSDNPVSLLLSRDAGPGSRLSAQLYVDDPDEGKVGKLTLKVGRIKWTGIGAEQAFSDAQTTQLLAAMLDADEVALADGKREWTLSLAGLKAALLKMDDVQGRVGTVGALVKKGGKPESAAPAAQPAPLLVPLAPPAAKPGDQKLLPAILKQLRAVDKACWDELPDAEHPDVQLYRLSASQVLVLRECGRGAYQGSYKAWTSGDAPPFHPREIPLRGSDGKETFLMNASFDKGELSSYAKGRGIGDCGSGASWAWTGKDFKLMSAQEAPQCRGIAGGVSLRTWVTRQK
ncbi:DUF1176 domain-containing protein [Chromobacterium violaceum]|uniref:DUF1176 domain-containing protein n=1 Tax=Chromobacterium violaceum TaxID=536 RepID=UPI001BE9ACD6|nr:DUF1176 domain-containing protein [Chromobacterium violaceum]MBT2869014.1 DUF1176 domain-containing protein [Chromobacterium violaceum]